MEKMMISDERYAIIASRVCLGESKAPMAEIGVGPGGVVARLANDFPYRQVYAYDTFKGLPKEKWNDGEIHAPGEFVDEEAQYSLARFRNVTIRKGIFPDTLGDETGFIVVHLDVDYYQSTKDALISIMPRMAKGGRIILDDWKWKDCPGVERAVVELGLNAVETAMWQAEIICK